TLYVDNLIGQNTVITLPPATYESYKRSGHTEPLLEQGLDEARALLAALPDIGIDLQLVTERLLKQGLKIFGDSHIELLESIRRTRDHLLSF
ncbi:transaldolase, partial [candidate division KSB1 bacterium]|nr:transaldolase [candidate division KSB1 bacterium]